MKKINNDKFYVVEGVTALIVTGAMSLMFILPSFADAAELSRQLDVGMSGSDVTALQQFLAADTSVYPEGLVTGYYGNLTASAVGRFQAKNGLESVGRVGPITLSVLTSQMSIGGIGGSDDVSAPVLMPETVVTGKNSATFNWYTGEPSFARVMYGNSWPFMFAGAPSVSGTGGLSTYQTVTVSGLAPNTRYYYVLESTDQSGNVNQTVGKPFTTSAN